MMDMHRLDANGGITPLWYDDKYPYSRVLDAWSNVIDALQDKWNFFAIDLKVQKALRFRARIGARTLFLSLMCTCTPAERTPRRRHLGR